MEPASDARAMILAIAEAAAHIERLRIIVIADGVVSDVIGPVSGIDGVGLTLDVWDHRRLFRALSSGLPYEPVTIDIAQRLGRPLACLPLPNDGADYRAFLAVVPGPLLRDSTTSSGRDCSSSTSDRSSNPGARSTRGSCRR